ncbi:MAG: 3-phosphoshikimate 1-carboxyvinyltransferase, partial [Acidimicrobiales bacterium]
MSTYTVAGGCPLRGTLRVPGDKSISHRALLLAALANGTSEVVGLSSGHDVQHTLAAIQSLGAEVDGAMITGGNLREPLAAIEVGNSGTGIRLLAGVCAAQPFHT